MRGLYLPSQFAQPGSELLSESREFLPRKREEPPDEAFLPRVVPEGKGHGEDAFMIQITFGDPILGP
ncbi:hypothetical protein DRJ27_05505 [Candidatus Acetothermia bacterium]|nr:MAG: hypothetical protein DRJ27_05505 [Candidatus Acetothermia bacterium]